MDYRDELRQQGLQPAILVRVAQNSGAGESSNLWKEILHDLRRIARAPTSVFAEALEGLVRVVRVVTLGGGRVRERRRLSRHEAFAEIRRIVAENSGEMLECNGKLIITLGKAKAGSAGRLSEQLAKIFNEEASSRLLLRLAGFPAEKIPSFTTPLIFWHRIVEEAANGASLGGVRALVVQAAQMYPANSYFQRAVHTLSRSEGVDL
jgi:Effector-associated domain 1